MTRLPQLERLLYDAIARSDAVGATSPPRWRRRRRLRVGGAALVAVVAITGAALAASGTLSPGPIGLGQYFAGQRTRPATRVDPAQAAAFAILRRPLTPGDAIPPSLRSAVEAGAYGANYALARRARDLPAGVTAWVVPGNGSLCLFANGGATCGPDLRPRGLAIESGSNTIDPHRESITGLVPDGVASVTITTGHHTRLTVAVHDNFYAADVRGGISYVTENPGHPPNASALGAPSARPVSRSR
jgi:hypothetical protein